MAQTSVTILGGTGTIGDNMLDLLRQHKDHACLYGVSGHKNLEKLCAIITEFSPQVVAVSALPADHQIAHLCKERQIELLIGDGAIDELAGRPVSVVVGAIVGMAGLSSVLAAAKAGQVIALANKESLVAAGHILMPLLPQTGAKIIPVDSEHNAIYQCLMGQNRSDVEKIILTASGGPFREYTRKEMAHITKADALAHPNWVMGEKVTIDSATLMNKGLELLEAAHLFNASKSELSALIHPQSVIHGMVEFIDGSVISHMATPDMRVPLGFALGLETRRPTGAAPINFLEQPRLDFAEIDVDKFPCFDLAFQIIDEAPHYSVILNAANEIAVAAFLSDKITFHQIPQLVLQAIQHNFDIVADSIDAIYELDRQARHFTKANL